MVGGFCKGGMDIIVIVVLTGESVGVMVTGFYDIWSELGGVKLKGDKMGDIKMIS